MSTTCHLSSHRKIKREEQKREKKNTNLIHLSILLDLFTHSIFHCNLYRIWLNYNNGTIPSLASLRFSSLSALLSAIFLIFIFFYVISEQVCFRFHCHSFNIDKWIDRWRYSCIHNFILYCVIWIKEQFSFTCAVKESKFCKKKYSTAISLFTLLSLSSYFSIFHA